MDSVNSIAIFRYHWLAWRLIGIVPMKGLFTLPYYLYSVLIHILTTIFYPLHLGMSLLRNDTVSDDVKNFGLFITVVACIIKTVLYWRNLDEVRKIESILAALDVRVNGTDQQTNYRTIEKNIRNIFYIFFALYMTVGVAAELTVILREYRTLIFPAWFPFDWSNSTPNYILASVYQIISTAYLLLMNVVDDSYPPMILCMLEGHIKLLGIRTTKIGHDCDDLAENERELKRCINDQENLYRLFDTIHQLISWPMFIQFTVSATNMCVALVALMFYVDLPIDRIYSALYFIAMLVQIFPTCYYGSVVQYLFSELQYEIFRCNWTEQSHLFKKHMMLYSERTLKETTAFAGGMVRIHLNTFFSTIKAAYSLFTVIMKIK